MTEHWSLRETPGRDSLTGILQDSGGIQGGDHNPSAKTKD